MASMSKRQFGDAIKVNLRRWLRRYAFSYVAYKRIRGTYSPETCPNFSIDIFVTNWGRSGNTYSAEMVKHLYKKLRIGSHAHSIGSLKCARNNTVPILLVYREPLHAVSSFIVKQRHVLPLDDQYAIHATVRDYCDYHKYVLTIVDHIAPISFSSMIGQPKVIVDAMCQFGFSKRHTDDMMAAHDEVMGQLRNDSRPPATRQLESAEKNSRKRKLYKQIMGDPNWPHAISIFEQLNLATNEKR